ncbi:low affinity immunoglobulin gamma Fc region receptor II [Oreochromis niloticus]|uniref:low affinity immunoglobulin gamma Fc region receptor II n=1 Tax=Oreochromis niloticus TaxID=8128 RepID=UPI00067426BD|nr:low affinity immunoglobulin gamma Fc region receptor II [Oreochromis niloticus]
MPQRKSLLVSLQEDIMEIRALCIRLLITIIIMLRAHAQKVFSLRVVPNKLQFFEYETVSFYCEGVFHGNIVHKVNGRTSQCNNGGNKTAQGSLCIMTSLYLNDGGQHWCEIEGGRRSNSVNISVTAGSVILESPAVPVMEGEDVTLRCRNKMISSNIAADFYKYGHHIGNSSTANMTIHRVYKSDEGLYKCKISGGGESPESWLSVSLPCVTADHTESQRDHSSNQGCHIYLVSRTVFTVAMVALLLVVVGLLHCGKVRARTANSSPRCKCNCNYDK